MSIKIKGMKQNRENSESTKAESDYAIKFFWDLIFAILHSLAVMQFYGHYFRIIKVPKHAYAVSLAAILFG